jgi:hypothetical protein
MVRKFVGDHGIAPEIENAAELGALPGMFPALTHAIVIDLSRDKATVQP